MAALAAKAAVATSSALQVAMKSYSKRKM